MSAFAAKNFQSHDYALHRPSYSIDFFKYLFKFSDLTNVVNETKTLSIVDIGAGPATCELVYIPYLIELVESRILDVETVKIYVTDVSATMIKEAESTLSESLVNHIPESLEKVFDISYHVIEGEKLNDVVGESSIDIVIAAECVHWINAESWLKSMNLVLKSDTGVLAFWGYVDPVFTGHEGGTDGVTKANQFYDDFVYEEEGKLGVYWQQPGRSILRGLCQDINNRVYEDSDSWKDVITVYRDPSKGSVKLVDRLINKDVEFTVNDEALKMVKSLTFEQFVQYADTWSSSHKWNQNHSEDEKVSKLFSDGLHKLAGWDLNDKIAIEMKTFYTLSKKI